MKICILHIGHTVPGEISKYPASPVRFRQKLEPLLPQAQWSVVSAVKDQLPDPSAFDVYLITGGKYSVYEDIDWQNRLFDFIRSLHAQKIPLIGICYGHQAIALALGGSVRLSEKGWGVGLMPVCVAQNADFRNAGEQVFLHAMHQDQVDEAPVEAQVFLESAFCPISGFTIGSHILGIQQHPDFNAGLSEELITKRIDRIGERASLAIKSLACQDDTDVSVRWMADFILKRFASKSPGLA